jgi:hypothetical protein
MDLENMEKLKVQDSSVLRYNAVQIHPQGSPRNVDYPEDGGSKVFQNHGTLRSINLHVVLSQMIYLKTELDCNYTRRVNLSRPVIQSE